MMKIVWLVFAIVTTKINAQENIFKNCSQIDFCRRLRHITLDDSAKFYGVYENISLVDYGLSVPLENKQGDTLIFQLSFMVDNTIRVKIKDVDNERFELKPDWALTGEPETEGFLAYADDFMAVIVSDNRSVNVFWGPPFIVEFYYNDELEVVFNGDRLIMENNNVSQAFAFEVQYKGAEKLYGLFDHSYKLALGETADDTSEPYRMKNTDASAYVPYPADSTMALYGTVSVIYGHSQNRTEGLFLHNGAEQWIDISYSGQDPTSYFMVESATLDLFVLLGPSPKEIVRQFTALTGTAHMPQLWVLGFHQCRMSYHSQEDVKETVALMQEYQFPMDAIWLARDYTDDNRWFKWNATAFSDPVEMQQNISALNKKIVTISDPHFKIDDNYDVYALGKAGDYFVKAPDGESDFEAICWPGLSTWIDFFKPSAADYYASWYSYDKWVGTTPVLAGIWNDMNEPAVFNGTEGTAAGDIIHRIDDEGTQVLHRDVHNLYGLMHVRATHHGLLQRDNNQVRPFILTRSHFAGSQRYAAMWTGDNSDTWQHFANSLSQCLTGNLLGMVICGPDVGGFFGNTSQELIQRWFQGGAWLPFYRAHSNAAAVRREPYLYPEDIRNVIRQAIELRYRHIPYLYTLVYEHTRTGDPVISPLFYHYPGIHEYDTQMLVGTDIMPVAVVNESVVSVPVFFPGDNQWLRIDRGLDSDSIVVYSGGQTQDIEVDITSSPVFYRAGSIITIRSDVKLSTTDTIGDGVNLVINVDTEEQANGRSYEDDYTSFEYQNGHYSYMNLHYNGTTNSIETNTIDGNPSGFSTTYNVIYVNALKETEGGTYKVVQTKYTHTRDGRLLSDIDIGSELIKSREGAFILEL